MEGKGLKNEMLCAIMKLPQNKQNELWDELTMLGLY